MIRQNGLSESVNTEFAEKKSAKSAWARLACLTRIRNLDLYARFFTRALVEGQFSLRISPYHVWFKQGILEVAVGAGSRQN